MSTPNLQMLLENTTWLRAFSRRLVGDEAGAEDLVQQTLLTGIRNPGDKRLSRSWLGRVARNLFIDELRRDRRRKQREVRAAVLESTPSTQEMAERFEVQEAVSSAVLDLDEKYRSIVFLHHFEGLSLREIAEQLDEPLETVRSRHRRALAQLRRKLDHRYGNRAAWALPLLTRADVDAALDGLPPASTPTALIGVFAAVVALVIATVWWLPDMLEDGTVTPPDPGTEKVVDRQVRSGTPSSDNGQSTPVDRDQVTPRRRLHIAGTVIELGQGDPIEGASVTLRHPPVGVVAQGRSGADGTFLIGDLPVVDRTTSFELEVRHPDFVAETVPLDLSPASLVREQILGIGRITLAGGTVVHGTVVDATGAPAVNTAVYYATSNGVFRRIAETATDGSFTAEEPLRCTEATARIIAWGPQGLAHAWVPLQFQNDEERIALRMGRAGSMTVTVSEADGTACEGATVTWLPREPAHKGRWAASSLGPDSGFAAVVAATTDATGRATLIGLPLADSGADIELTVRSTHGPLAREVRMDVSAQATPSLDVQLPPASGEEARIEVVSAAGRRLGEVDWELHLFDRTLGRGRSQSPIAVPLPHHRHPALELRLRAFGHVERSVTVDGDELPAKVELTEGRIVRGNVFFGGQVATGARVATPDGAASTVADSLGAFQLTIPAAVRELWTSGPADGPALGPAHTVLAERDEALEIHLPEPSGVTLLARIVDRRNRPLDARVAHLERLGQPGTRRHMGQGVGVVAARWLQPGTWSLTVTTAQGHTFFKVIHIPEEGARDVSITLQPGPVSSVAGELDLSGLPPSLRNRPLTLVHSFSDEGARWVHPETGGALPPGMQVDGVAHALRLSPGETRFRIDGLDSRRKSIDVFLTDSGPLVGGRSIELNAGKRRVVSIPVRVGGVTHFDWSGGDLRHDVQLWYRELGGDGNWSTLRRITAQHPGARIPPFALQPGSYEWCLTTPIPHRPASGSDTWLAAIEPLSPLDSGTFHLNAGQTTRIPIGAGLR